MPGKLKTKSTKFQWLRKFYKNASGVAAIEFALLAPVFFIIVFVMLEALAFMAAKVSLESATKEMALTMQQARNEKRSFTIDELREAACTKAISIFVKDCDEDHVKVSVYYSGRLPNRWWYYSKTMSLPIKNYLDNTASTSWGDVWIIGVQVDWPFTLPTTSWLTNDATQNGKPKLVNIQTTIIPRELNVYGNRRP